MVGRVYRRLLPLSGSPAAVVGSIRSARATLTADGGDRGWGMILPALEEARKDRPDSSQRIDLLASTWRVTRMGLAFAVYGVGALAMSGVVLPVSRRLRPPGRPAWADAQARIAGGYRFFVRTLRHLGLFEIRIHGLERLRAAGGHLFVVNHPTLFDAPILLAELPQADCVTKRSWARNPFLRGSMRAAQTLVAEDGGEMIDEAVRRLRDGRTLVMFPEGTRSPVGGLGPFSRGAAHVAIKSGLDLVPVVIHCDRPVHVKDRPWWEVPELPVRIRVEVCDSMSPKHALDGDESPGVAARKVTRALRETFEKRLSRAEA